MAPFFEIWTFLFGLVLGSFLNVCIYRMPRDQSVVKPRSYCPECGHFVRWQDNVPVLAYLWLRGRCRSCRKPFSIRYPLVELLTGLLSLAVWVKFQAPLPYFFYFVLLTAPLIAITFIDLEHKIIPDVFSLSGIFSGILANLFLAPMPILESLLFSFYGILAGGGALFLVSWVYEKLRHQEGIGGGDIKLAAMLGAFFGWKAIFFILFLSSLLGSVVGVVLVVIFRRDLKFAVPFGPFLAAAAMLYLFYGPQIIAIYLKLPRLGS